MTAHSKQIILYGSSKCHKSNLYKAFFEKNAIAYTFKDVVLNEEAAVELRGLYQNGRLNFPTIVVKGKRLRNPKIEDLKKALK